MNQQEEIMSFLENTQEEIKRRNKGTLYPKTITDLTGQVLRALPVRR